MTQSQEAFVKMEIFEINIMSLKIEGPNSEYFFVAVVKVGHAMHQARFSYEDFSYGAAWNVEILDYCENAAARLR